jgi:2-keto-3-deoxy-L-rhamnonate aldolase RhmA
MVRKLAMSALALAVAGLATGAGRAARQGARASAMIRLLEAGEVVFGSFVEDKSPGGAEALSRDRRLDFVFYDMEHAEFDPATLTTFIEAARRAEDRKAVLVRIAPLHDDPAAAKERIRAVVGAGADGIVLPHVLDPAEARQGIAWIEEATDRLWPVHPDGDFLAFLMVEDPDSVGRAREIFSTTGVGVGSPGPGSLRQAYGGDMKAVEAAVESVLGACKASGVPCANTAREADVESKVRRGFRVLITQGEALDLGRRAAGRTP